MKTGLNTKIKQLLSQKDSDELLFKDKMLQISNWKEMQEIVTEFGNNGWSRKKLFDICQYINFNEELREEEYDVFAEVMDGLTGFCNGVYFLRLPNDPVNDNEFIEYVRSNVWQNESW
ncbi:MAG: hypothetical protein U0Y10_16295 [Spirosomataceae bacterium]